MRYHHRHIPSHPVTSPNKKPSTFHASPSVRHSFSDIASLSAAVMSLGILTSVRQGGHPQAILPLP